MAKRRFDQIANGDRRGDNVAVRGAAFRPGNVGVVNLSLASIFDHGQTLVERNEMDQRFGERGSSGTGSAAEQNVLGLLNSLCEKISYVFVLLRPRLCLDQPAEGEPVRPELADRGQDTFGGSAEWQRPRSSRRASEHTAHGWSSARSFTPVGYGRQTRTLDRGVSGRTVIGCFS